MVDNKDRKKAAVGSGAMVTAVALMKWSFDTLQAGRPIEGFVGISLSMVMMYAHHVGYLRHVDVKVSTLTGAIDTVAKEAREAADEAEDMISDERDEG